MGLFTSKKQEPLPDVVVTLATSQDTVFRPDDTVSGHVTLSTPFPLTPQAVEVSLWGESKVWIRRSSSSSNNSTDYQHYRDNAPLFTVTYNLFPDPHQLQPGQDYNFPFHFRVPEGTAFTRPECYRDPTEQPYTVLPHNLPPTFFFGYSEDIPDNAGVFYGVTARLIAPGVGVGKDVEPVSSTIPILFQPLNPNVRFSPSILRHTKNFTLASSSLTGAEPSKIGFRQRMHDRFSSQTPKMDFEVAVEIPARLNAAQEFQFRTSFAVLNKGDNVTHIPPINIKVLDLKLLDFTFFRATYDWSASNTMSGWQHKNYKIYTSPGKPDWTEHVYREKKTALNAIPESHTIELQEVPVVGEKGKKEMEQETKCDVWFNARLPGQTVPSFVSFAIVRAYRVKAKIGVEIGEKKFVYELESHVQHLGS
ncbi:hypothetical protein CC78DRAFT_564515 [Lojkania enalia]|uniref:Arrestin-like N-terminal domain-containing protein n=1 Tax=Lojkania enalia TaxID=147567 RepID=A0A9P4TQZ4_9PLEO|nr:hypothetical protein CC78DRAFT_564515 [Didymosphaeria enalia]